MNSKPFYKKTGFIVLISILVLLTGAFVYISHSLEDIIKVKLEEALHKNPQRKYNIDFKDLNLALLQGDISIQNISITPRQNIIDSLDKAGIHQSLLANLSVNEIDLNGVNLQKLLNGDLELNSFYIENPAINLHFTGYKKEVKDTVDPIETMYKIGADLQALSVHSIQIKNGMLRISSVKKDTFIIVNGLHLNLQDFTVDTNQKHIPIDLSDLKLDFDSVWVNASKLHNIEVNKISTHFRDSTLAIGSFKLIPKQSKEAFSKTLKYEKPWQKVSTKSILVEGIGFIQFLFEKELNIRQITVNDVDAYLYKDKTPDWPYFKSHPIPSAFLRKLPFELNVKNIALKSSYLRFEQKQVGHEMLGKLTLSNIWANVYNITNKPELIKKNKFLTIDGKMKMMGEGDMKAKLKFDLSNTADNWSLNAQIGSMNMASLNPILYPLSDVKIESGQLKGVDLNMNCNRLTALGTIDVEYENAKIDIQMFDKEDHSNYFKGLISFVANGVIRTNNIKGTPHYRQGKIDYTRSMDHPFFRFLWFSVQNGLIDTFVGYGDKSKRKARRLEKEKNKNNKKSLFNVKLKIGDKQLKIGN